LPVGAEKALACCTGVRHDRCTRSGSEEIRRVRGTHLRRRHGSWTAQQGRTEHPGLPTAHCCGL